MMHEMARTVRTWSLILAGLCMLGWIGRASLGAHHRGQRDSLQREVSQLAEKRQKLETEMEDAKKRGGVEALEKRLRLEKAWSDHLSQLGAAEPRQRSRAHESWEREIGRANWTLTCLGAGYLNVPEPTPFDAYQVEDHGPRWE